MSRRALLIDFGSTFTKVRAADLDSGVLLAQAQSPSTVETNVMDGLNRGMALLWEQIPDEDPDDYIRLASSSAAGGLRVVAIGLIRGMTAEAAKRAALGAGAKVIASYAGLLSARELKEIEALAPDMIVLSGGTDGGDTACLLGNAEKLSISIVNCPIVVAGNQKVADEAGEILESCNKVVTIVDNVMPAVDRLETVPCSEAIRNTFMERIVQTKGLSEAESFVGQIVMPTPGAVLKACELLAHGPPGDEQLGELVCFDVGGATTDVYSIATGSPTTPGAVLRGLPEPKAKRTVEGDLGLRVNAVSTVEVISEVTGSHGYPDSDEARITAETLATRTDTLPVSAEQWQFDRTLAAGAARVAARRHAGTIEVGYGPEGKFFVQRGKDLRPIRTVIATGGVFAASDPETLEEILEGVMFSGSAPESLLPIEAEALVDRDYVLYAVGLLADVDPVAAYRIGASSLSRTTFRMEGVAGA